MGLGDWDIGMGVGDWNGAGGLVGDWNGGGILEWGWGIGMGLGDCHLMLAITLTEFSSCSQHVIHHCVCMRWSY